jgi:hypothetical protein
MGKMTDYDGRVQKEKVEWEMRIEKWDWPQLWRERPSLAPKL